MKKFNFDLSIPSSTHGGTISNVSSIPSDNEEYKQNDINDIKTSTLLSVLQNKTSTSQEVNNNMALEGIISKKPVVNNFSHLLSSQWKGSSTNAMYVTFSIVYIVNAFYILLNK